ncbi:acyltransferase family protein [Dankookia sp. GCM10030260]|uniref:acyltransferase family protein n=1 Tax=Dankookia sp. GCM10030260 TaxID=3273390 RepID=UPI00360F3940
MKLADISSICAAHLGRIVPRIPKNTLEDQLKLSGNRPSGFDYLRIILAVSIVFWHTVMVCYGLEAEIPFWTGWTRPLIFSIVPAFFALSGFLVAGSLLRNSLPAFLMLRALRIYPALACEVIISALIIGPALTVYTYSEYFSDPLFYRYMLNAIGYIHYELPGVFLDNPGGRAVNVQLWTVPYELECYLAITGLAILGITRWPVLLAAAIAGLTVMSMGKDHTDLLVNSVPPGRLLVLAFLSGVLLYLWRKRITGHVAFFVLVLIVALQLLGTHHTATLSALPLAYVTVWLGLRNPPRNILVAGADYSYGIYLYGFAIQQAIAFLLPEYRIWYVNGILTILFASAFAYLSWHFIELPVMQRKHHILSFFAVRTRRAKEMLFQKQNIKPQVVSPK